MDGEGGGAHEVREDLAGPLHRLRLHAVLPRAQQLRRLPAVRNAHLVEDSRLSMSTAADSHLKRLQPEICLDKTIMVRAVLLRAVLQACVRWVVMVPVLRVLVYYPVRETRMAKAVSSGETSVSQKK